MQTRERSPCFLVPFLAAVIAAFAAPRAAAQLVLPKASPAAKVSLEVGPAKVEIAYARPARRGRDVRAELAAAGAVWRLGANEATTITLDEAASIGGQRLPAGKYALFARVGADGGDGPWTLLFNRTAQQWGSYFHDPKQDALRVELKPRRLATAREWFTIGLDPKDDDSATVTIAWDTVELAFDLDFDVAALVERNLARAVAELAPKDWDTRLQIVKHWVGRGERLADALRLAEAAVAIEANFWTLEWNARALHALQDVEAAIPLLERAIEAAKVGPPPEYRAGLERLLAAWQAE